MERIQVSKDWSKKYEEIKDLLISPVNYAQCFGMEEIQGKKRYNQDLETGYILCILDMTRITGFVMSLLNIFIWGSF